MPVHTELFYEHEIDTECLLYNDLPTQCRYFTPAQFSTNFSGTDRANNPSVIHFNARSLKANLNKMKDTLRELEYKFHIIAISETWFKENNWDGNEVTNLHDAFLGYKLYCNSRKNKTGGGVQSISQSINQSINHFIVLKKDMHYTTHDLQYVGWSQQNEFQMYP